MNYFHLGLHTLYSKSSSSKHRHGNRGSRGSSCSPNKTIGGTTSSSCSPNFFCNLQLKVTLQTVTYNTEILENSPASGLPQTPLYTAYTLWKNTYCIKLCFEFDCLDCFSPIFASSTEKGSIFAPQPKNRSRAYGSKQM